MIFHSHGSCTWSKNLLGPTRCMPSTDSGVIQICALVHCVCSLFQTRNRWPPPGAWKNDGSIAPRFGGQIRGRLRLSTNPRPGYFERDVEMHILCLVPRRCVA